MSFAVGAVLLFGCAEPVEKSADTGNSDARTLSVAEARSIFEDAVVGLACSRAELENLGFFKPGDIDPVWSKAREVAAGEFMRVDVPVDATYGFCRFVFCEETEVFDLVMIPRTLVVMKDPDSERQSVYFCHYIADDDFADWYADRPQQEWIDGQAKNYFSGIVLYTTLSGRIAAVGRYDHGRLGEGLFFGASSLDREKILDRFGALFGIAYIARNRIAGFTRGVNDNNMIEEVIILGPPKEGEDSSGDFDWEPGVPPIRDDGSSHGGGGGNGNSSSPCPKVQTNDDKVIALLRELDGDCMASALFKSIKPYVKIVSDAGFGSGCKTTVRNIYYSSTVPVQEFTIELGPVLKDISLFEELIHVYQYTGSPNMKDDRINFEVEAKLGWYMYRVRIGCFDGIAGALGGKDGIMVFDRLSKYFVSKDFESSGFYEAYDAAVSALRGIKAYSDETKYPLNRTARNFRNLEQLMKNC